MVQMCHGEEQRGAEYCEDLHPAATGKVRTIRNVRTRMSQPSWITMPGRAIRQAVLRYRVVATLVLTLGREVSRVRIRRRPGEGTCRTWRSSGITWDHVGSITRGERHSATRVACRWYVRNAVGWHTAAPEDPLFSHRTYYIISARHQQPSPVERSPPGPHHHRAQWRVRVPLGVQVPGDVVHHKVRHEAEQAADCDTWRLGGLRWIFLTLPGQG